MAVWSLAVVLLLAAGRPPLQAQDQTPPGTSYRIDTVAGGGVGDGGPAVEAHFYVGNDGWLSVATDATGNVYVAGYESSRVRRIDTAGVISTFAGTGEDGFSGDGGPATEIPIAEIVRGGPRSPDTTPQAWHHFSDARPS